MATRRTKPLMINGEEFLPVPEAAAHMGLALSTFYELMKAGKIQFAKVLSRTLVSTSSMDAYLTSCIVAPEDARDVIEAHRRNVKTDPTRKPGRAGKRPINRADLAASNGGK